MTNQRNAGYTLTELAIVLGIIGVIAGAIWGVASDAGLNRKMATTNNQVTTIVGNVRTIYAEQGGISGTQDVLTPALDRLRAFPLDMRQNQAVAAGVLFHQWSSAPAAAYPSLGNVLVTAANCTTGLPTTGSTSIETCFGVIFYNLTQNACAQFATGAISTATGMQLTLINGNILSTFPTDIVTANSATNCAKSTASNSVEFVYLLKEDSQ